MRRIFVVLLIAGGIPALTFAQGGGAGRGGPPPTAKAAAPVDLTGYWVSPIFEDYRWRMFTPLKGDAASVPINAAARKIVDAWDPARDEAAGEQCKAYGAAGLMRVPGYLHITWQDDNTLKIETTAGTQTRLFHFGGQPPTGGAPSWQGYSSAMWDPPIPRGPAGVAPNFPRAGLKSRSLDVVTTQLREGYLRKNGVPYSASTTLTEYLDRVNEPDGNAYLVVTTTVEDPAYLAQPFLASSHYRKQPDSAGWKPRPCAVK